LKGLVSFTLFGDQPLYVQGALRNAKLWKEGELDVTCAFAVGDSVPESVIEELKSEGALILRMRGMVEDQTATFWRYAFLDPLYSDGYDYYLSRDVDSRPSFREYYALNEWLKHHLEFHVIRDHPFHGVPILAGLFGVRASLFPLIHENLPYTIPDNFYETVVRACNHLTVNYESNDFYQVDQWWLRLNVHPKLRNKIMAHDEFFGFERRRFRYSLPPRIDNEFVAECRDENEELRHPTHRFLLDDWPHRAPHRTRGRQ